MMTIMGSGFGKKQKKDIKGMIKKILLYGGLPTLVVVSLGILSNKKIGKRKQKNSKIKVSEEEKRFKQVFVKKLKEIILKRNQVLSDMEEDFKENVIETNKREINRRKKSNLIEDAAMNNKVSLEIIEKNEKKHQVIKFFSKLIIIIKNGLLKMKKIQIIILVKEMERFITKKVS